MRGYFTQAFPLMIEFTLWSPTRLATLAENAICCLMSSFSRHLCFFFSLYLCSKMVSGNVFSELCYDLNMMRNLSSDGSLSPKMTTEAYYIVPKGRESHFEQTAGTDPVLWVPSHMSADKSDQPYHHHPQDGRTSSSLSHNDNVARRSTEMDDPRTSDIFSDNQRNVTSRAGLRRDSECDVQPEVGEASSEQGDNKPESNVHQQPGVTASKKLERQEDIVERNKITLGRNTFPGGSYRMAYAHKQSRAHNGNKVRRQTLISSGTLFCCTSLFFHRGLQLRSSVIKKTNKRNPLYLAPSSQFRKNCGNLLQR